jgi:hypothetical protein
LEVSVLALDQSMDGIVKASVEMADKLLKEFEKQQ